MQTQNQRALLNELEQLLVCKILPTELPKLMRGTHSKLFKSTQPRFSRSRKNLWSSQAVSRIWNDLFQSFIKLYWLDAIGVRLFRLS